MMGTLNCYCVALFVLLTSVATLPGQAAETPEVLVELTREQVYVGEAVNYRVMLNHCGMQAEPDMSKFTGFDVKLVNKVQIQNARIISKDGQRQRVIEIGPLYEYELTPHATGTIQVPAPTVEIDGKTYVGKSLLLQVADLDDQDLVYLNVTTEPESVYPMQPVQIRLSMTVKGLPESAADHDPLELRRTLPSLTIPWADDEQLGDALQPKEPLSRWISPYVNESSYGVAINDYQQADRGLFGGMGLGGGVFGGRRDARLAFLPTPKRALREDGQGRSVEYWEYVFERTVIPQKVGEYPLGTVNLKGQFAARINTRGNVELDPVYAIAPPAVLVVKDPPMVGRPRSYAGAIGTFVGGAEMTPVSANVGDPMTLTVWLRGAGTLTETMAPDLSANADIAEQFKVYEATEQTDDDTRRFTYSLRPKTAAAKQFPAIPILTYFDVNQEKYVTLKSDPIALSISPSSQLATSDIEMATSAQNPGGDIGTLSAGIFANVTDLSQLRNDRVRPTRWFYSLGGLAGLFVVIAIAKQRWQQTRADTGLQRRKGALGRARGRLKSVRGGNSQEIANGIHNALVGLVADVRDLPMEGLTSTDAAQALEASDVSAPLVDRFRALLETCDAMRYASEGTPSAVLEADAQSLLKDLTQELHGRKLVA